MMAFWETLDRENPYMAIGEGLFTWEGSEKVMVLKRKWVGLD